MHDTCMTFHGSLIMVDCTELRGSVLRSCPSSRTLAVGPYHGLPEREREKQFFLLVCRCLQYNIFWNFCIHWCELLMQPNLISVHSYSLISTSSRPRRCDTDVMSCRCICRWAVLISYRQLHPWVASFTLLGGAIGNS